MDASQTRTRLSIKIFQMDYYFAKPISDIDQSYSELRGAYTSKLPIVRIFGTSPTGQKICANVHGVLPYFYVLCPPLNQSFVGDYLRNFSSDLERALCTAADSSITGEPVVFSATIVSGRSIYGFSAEESLFIKISVLDPSILQQCAEVLLSGKVMGRSFQPFETHIPFLLKFCIDYNLYGMNYLHTDYFKIRASSSECRNAIAEIPGVTENIWHSGVVPSNQLLWPDIAPRLTSTNLEVDISAPDILNRMEQEGAMDSNPGLEALWLEERHRRDHRLTDSSPSLPELPSPDELLPLTKPGVIPPSTSEIEWLVQWEQLRQRIRMDTVDSVLQTMDQLDDFVSNWLASSPCGADDNLNQADRAQTDDGRAAPVQVFTLQRKDSQSSRTGSSGSLQTRLTSASRPELVRLVQATEEMDAPVFQPNNSVSLDWSLLKAGTEMSLSDRDAANHMPIESVSRINSSAEATNLSVPVLSQSQDLLASQLDPTQSPPFAGCSSSHAMADSHVLTVDRHTDDTDDTEATIVSSVTRAALSYMSKTFSQRDSTGGYTSPLISFGYDTGADAPEVVDTDDATMSELIHSDKDELSVVSDEYWDSFDEPFDETEHILDESNTLRGPSIMERLAPVGELDEPSDLSDESVGSDFASARTRSPHQSPCVYRSSSGWTPHSVCALSPQLLQSDDSQALEGPDKEEKDDNDVSELLFTTTRSLDTDDSDQTLHQIPQLDGHGDDDQSDTTGSSVPARTRRRRLGLRLTSRSIHTSKLSRMDNPAVVSCQVSEQSSTFSTPPCSVGVPDGDSLRTTLATLIDPFQQNHSGTDRLSTASDCEQYRDSVQNLCVNVGGFESSVKDQTLMNPTVILERLEDWVSSERAVSSTALQNSKDALLLTPIARQSPPDEFEDLAVSGTDCGQLMDSDDRDVSAFRPSDNSHSFPCQLTLFSETQCSPRPISPLPIQPLEVGIYTKLLPEWRCTRAPPSFSSVLQWTQACGSCPTSGPATPMPDGLHGHSKSTDTSMSEETLSPEKSASSKIPGQSLTNQVTADDAANETACERRPSSVCSVSVLYQAASQRCFLPVQVDHTTVASLELHCRVRMCSGRRLRPSGDGSRPFGDRHLPSHAKPRIKSVRFGLLPDPAFDPVCLACLSLRKPSEPTDLFVLINQSELRGFESSSDVTACTSDHADSRRWRMGFLSNWTTGAQGAVESRSQQRISSRDAREKPQPKWIWCRDEWDLYNWIAYLVQRFDPEILLGYDVERASWGYLVERATAHLQRQSYARELSRLAPDILQCTHCSLLIAQCGRLVPGGHTNTEDVLRGLSYPADSCSCPCRTGQAARERPLQRPSQGWPSGPGAGRTGGPFPCPGRVVLCLWRVLMSEVSLFEYSLETVVRRLLKETVPGFSAAQLHQWLTDSSGSERWRTVDYWLYRSVVNLRLISQVDLVGRTSEFARVFGIEFYHVLSRGSQYRVESLLGRTARSNNFLLPSPSVAQRARQRAPEAIPLTLEPESRLFVDGPVAVLDFQSLYPSIIIAYNYCYSTLLGRLQCLSQGEGNVFELGCLSHSLPPGLIDNLDSNVTVSPNGVVFVKSSIREGILPSMLKQLLRTRLMVKDSMKLYKSNKSLTRLLDARQLGLKLMANVIYGYTAASFSGRMPCVDLGDSIVHKARETLENAIRMVHEGLVPMPAGVHMNAPCRVVYGDTDSLFVHLPGLGRTEAFAAAEAIAQAVSAANPAPIKLKLEKIYYPCLLEAKKRYAGYAYENPTQTEPVFDAKGIETVRRDCCPFVSQMLEDTLRTLFSQFALPASIHSEPPIVSAVSDVTHRDQLLQLAESRMRELVRAYAHRLLRGQIPFADCILTRPYWGQASYRPGAFAPALQAARRLISMDPRLEPAVGERVVYYLAPGRPDQTLISCVRTLSELCPPVSSAHGRRALSPRLNVAYYLDKQLKPPLVRMAQLLGWRVDFWLQDLPRFHTIGANHRPSVRITPSAQAPSSLNRLDSMDSPSSSYSQSSSLLSGQYTSPVGGSPDPYLPVRSRRPRRRRPSAIMRAFVRQPARHCCGCDTVSSAACPLDQFGYCQRCLFNNPRLSVIGPVQFGIELNRISRHLNHSELICTGCLGHRGRQFDAIWLCTNVLCPMHSARLQATSQLALFWARHSTQLTHLDSSLSW